MIDHANRRKLNRVAFERGHAVHTFAIHGTLLGVNLLRDSKVESEEAVSIGNHRQPIRLTLAPRGCANVSQEPFDSTPVA